MSLGIAFKGPEGIVLAVDSRVTLTAQMPRANRPALLVPSTFDNATKMLRVKGQGHVGAVTYGAGAIGHAEPRTAHSFIPEFEQELGDANRLSVEDFSNRLSNFFLKKWEDQKTLTTKGADMVFLVGGYDEGAPYGRVFDIFIPSRPSPFEWHSGPGQFGPVWGGQKEYVDRLIQGFDDRVPDLAKGFLSLDNQKREELRQHLKSKLQVPVPFAFLPLQDCVDFAVFLIRTTITMQHWIMGVRGVGGAIDVAVITQMDGFMDIQKKRIKGEERW